MKWVQILHKLVDTDLKHLLNWLNVNKILVSAKRTEMVIFTSTGRKFKGDLKKIYMVQQDILLKVLNN